MAVFRALNIFDLLYSSLRVLLAFDDFNHARRLVGPDVVADDGVESARFVAVQKYSKLGDVVKVCVPESVPAG